MSVSDWTVTPLGSGRYRVSQGSRQWLTYGVTSGDVRWVFVDGYVYVVDASPPSRRKARQGHDDSALASPMPATVAAINVEPGQQVAQGDVLVMLEAMKMELQVKAPRDGRVTAITCRLGELVQPGIPLLSLE